MENRTYTRAVFLIVLLELEISGVVVQRIHQNSKNGDFCGGLLSDYGVNASETVPKITAYQIDYDKCFFCLIVC